MSYFTSFTRSQLLPWKVITLSFALTAALFSGSLTSSGVQAQASGTQTQSAAASSSQAYLQQRFGVALSDNLTKGEFIQATAALLKLKPAKDAAPVIFDDLKNDSPLYPSASALFDQGILTGSSVQASNRLTQSAAVYIALKASGLKELAYTYPDAKVETALKRAGITSPADEGLTKQAAQELAAVIDTGLLPAAWLNSFQAGSPASGAFAADLLQQVLAFHGEAKTYIGTINDEDIFLKLNATYKTQNLIQVPELQTLVDEALKQNLITGYNLKDDRFNPHFDPALSLTYGHSDIKHAIQLIGLLRSEGIQAKVQLEPKTSAYIYLKEWGEPGLSDDFKVVQIENGNFIAYSKEYDLSLEFEQEAQKLRFQHIINAYAKKNSEDTSRLLAGSWWQPLYYSLPQVQDYVEIANNRIDHGYYYAQSFTLKEQAAALKEGLTRIKPGTEVQSYRFWVDQPFYNYLIGDYK